ncbi:MAG: SET domain-containing protein [Bacteroidia bacterium]|nr:SET domain-containing protein [Bacteroidia bacterium]
MALIIKKSQLPSAGKGLYTTKNIKKDSIIIEYRGEIIDWKEYGKRVKEDKDGYMVFINRKKCIDAYNTPQYKARYANDAEGLIKIKNLKNNAEYQIINDKVYIVATRDIKAGEEIFVSYSKDYWDAVKYNIKHNLYKPQKLNDLKKLVKKYKIKL